MELSLRRRNNMSLSYELCKKLKEAGFIQPDLSGEEKWHGHYVHQESQEYYRPILEELIDVLYSHFEKIQLLKAGEDNYTCVGWSIKSHTKDNLGIRISKWDKSAEGKTPIESVAKLYLKLNEK